MKVCLKVSAGEHLQEFPLISMDRKYPVCYNERKWICSDCPWMAEGRQRLQAVPVLSWEEMVMIFTQEEKQLLPAGMAGIN